MAWCRPGNKPLSEPMMVSLLTQYAPLSLNELRNICKFEVNAVPHSCLTHWGRVMHICISKLIIIGSDNGLSPERCQAIIWIIAGILLIGTLGTNFSEILIKRHSFSFTKNAFENVVWKMAAILSRPQCVNTVRCKSISKHRDQGVTTWQA